MCNVVMISEDGSSTTSLGRFSLGGCVPEGPATAFDEDAGRLPEDREARTLPLELAEEFVVTVVRGVISPGESRVKWARRPERGVDVLGGVGALDRG